MHYNMLHLKTILLQELTYFSCLTLQPPPYTVYTAKLVKINTTLTVVASATWFCNEKLLNH